MSNLPDLIVPLKSGEDEGIQYMCEARLLDTSVVSLSACKLVFPLLFTATVRFYGCVTA